MTEMQSLFHGRIDEKPADSEPSGSFVRSEKLAVLLASVCAVVTIIIGAIALFGWIVDSPSLRGLSNPSLQMKPNSTIAFVLAGIALLCLKTPGGKRGRLGNACALVVAMIGLTTLAEYVFGVDFGIDQFFFSEPVYSPGIPPGRMVPASAINFFAKGVALLILDWETKRGRRPAQYLSLLTSIAPFLIIVGYSHGSEVVGVLKNYPYLTQMSPQTAVAWLALSLGTLCARPRAGFMRAIFADSHSAAFLRRVLPMAILTPPLLAWLLALGGKSALLFPGFGGSMFTLVSSCLLISVIWKSARDLTKNETALKEGQEKLREANERLRQSEDALKEHVEKLAKSNAELEQYASVASHDLKEPLRTITNYTQMIAREHRGKLGEKTDTNIQFINDATKRMYDLIDDLLEYSRAGRTEAPLRSVDCNALVQTVISNLRENIRENNAEVSVGVFPPVQGDSIQLSQLFQNLISNALKYRSKKPPRIEIKGEIGGGVVRVAVSDNGIGIEPRFFEKIFGLFQRLHARDQYGGTGIGLALCKRIVARHEGRIWVESIPNEGSTFFFTLPTAPLANLGGKE